MFVLVTALATMIVAVTIGAPAGVAAASQCPNGYFLDNTTDFPQYASYDQNGNGLICLQSVVRKGSTQKVTDDRLVKK
jgi:hypothetical protein